MRYLTIAYALLLGVLLWMCGGCATGDYAWMGTSEDYRHSYLDPKDPATWRPYHNYRQPACELCGKAPTEWSHEKPRVDYPELLNDPNNGHSLCRKCHTFFHFQNTSRYWCENMDEIIEVLKANKRTYKKYEN